MKKKISLLISAAFLLVILIHGCKKDSTSTPPTDIGTRVSFIEEFDSVYKLQAKGWVVQDNSSLNGSGPYAAWTQGYKGYDKAGVWSGFSAYSYTTTTDEFVYSEATFSAAGSGISSWLISPVLSVKNGDKISFYVRGDTVGSFTDRLQVRLNNSASADVGSHSISTGGFSTILFDINSSQAAGGFPTTWTKYEYTFSGIPGRTDTRIAFRHYVTNSAGARGIGIDLFSFQVN